MAAALEDQGLEGLRVRSRRSDAIPHATKPEVFSKIVYLRQHHHSGPHKIAMYLERYQDIDVSPSESGYAADAVRICGVSETD